MASTKAFKRLSAAAAHAALHDSAARFDAPRCYRNTRAAYRGMLEMWLLGTSAELEGIHLIWLYGGAGVGKSAILQSVVERCVQHTVILGTFFFFRSDSSRNYVEVLIPTLAYQLARAFPAAMAILETIIDRDPLIFKSSLDTQAYQLLVRPILHLIDTGVFETTSTLRRVFVIDGLDECTDPQKQALLINVVASILRKYDLPIHFLISSRPEIAISLAFQQEAQLQGMFVAISLDDDHDSRADIRQFIEDSFGDIIDGHPMRKHIALPWPNAQSIDNLVWKTSGHFIYAVTAMKFIASSDEHPARALQVIEGLEASRTQSPFAELDALYHHILTSAKYAKQAIGILRQCFLIHLGRGSPIFWDSPTRMWQAYSVSIVSLLQDISPADVDLFLSDLQALVSVTFDGYSNDLVVRPKHLSLEDFFKNEARSQGLYMAPGAYHASLISRFFYLFRNDTAKFISSSGVEYSSHAQKKIPTNGGHRLILAFCIAITHCHDSELLNGLVRQLTLKDIWSFYDPSPDPNSPPEFDQIAIVRSFSVAKYMTAIRDCVSHHFLLTEWQPL